jgi:soluble lytic murein transglycosylase-like protein
VEFKIMPEDNVEVQGGLPVSVGKTGAVSPMGKIALDPTQTSEILRNMQAMIDERTSPLSELSRGLEKASAWAVPSLGGQKAQALATVNEQQSKQAQELFNMRTQMAAYKAAQAQAEAFKKRAAQQLGGAAPAGTRGTTEATIPPQIQQALQNALDQNDQASYDKIYNAWAQKQAEVYANPAMDEPKIPVTEIVNGKPVRRVISAREYRANPDKYQDTPQTQAAVDTIIKTAPVVSGGDVLPKLKQAVFSTESSAGRADTTKPGVQGAMGPMQITADTFDTFKSRGVIPKEYDINNPEHNKDAGEKILDYYFKKYNGDVDKTLAAYHGGEGAINADGTINTQRKDALGTNIGDYVAKNKAAMGVTVAPAQVAATTATPTPATANPKPTPEALEQQDKINQKGSETFAEKVGTTNAAKADQIDTSGLSAPERSIRYNDVISITEDPQMKQYLGLLAKKGVAPFLLKTLESGVNAGQFGTLGFADLEKNLMEAKAPPEVIQKLHRLQKHLSAAELEYAQTYLKGQGSVSDNERKLVKDTVGSIKDPAAVLKMQAQVMVERAKFDDKIAKAYNDYRTQNGEYAPFGAFMRGPAAQAIINQHKTELGGILGKDTSNLNDPFKGSAAPSSSGAAKGDIGSFHKKK